MSNKLPAGVVGIIIAAIIAAAMSTISTCLNSSSTILLIDLYKRYFRRKASDKESMLFLRLATIFFGVIGTGATILMIGVQSILAVWWQLTGIFSGAMLGLFLLGFIVKKADNIAAVTSVIMGILIIVWMTFSSNIDCIPAYLQNPFHTNMTVVISTLSMFLIGVVITGLRNNRTKKSIEID
jgi:SSS family solute:Na+ symporter